MRELRSGDALVRTKQHRSQNTSANATDTALLVQPGQQQRANGVWSDKKWVTENNRRGSSLQHGGVDSSMQADPAHVHLLSHIFCQTQSIQWYCSSGLSDKKWVTENNRRGVLARSLPTRRPRLVNAGGSCSLPSFVTHFLSDQINTLKLRSGQN